MFKPLQIGLFVLSIFLIRPNAVAQDVNQQKGVINFLTPVLSDPVLQHSKELFVLNGCAYCHGVNLIVRNGEAADLLHSSLVGKDDNGNLIGPVLRAGIPQTPKLSPMPQFSDLSDQEIASIVRWIHYARQQARYRELAAVQDFSRADVAAGKRYFDAECSSCHSVEGDVQGFMKRYDSKALTTHVLLPEFAAKPRSFKIESAHDSNAAAEKRHLALLENYSQADFVNLIAYLKDTKVTGNH